MKTGLEPRASVHGTPALPAELTGTQSFPCLIGCMLPIHVHKLTKNDIWGWGSVAVCRNQQKWARF